MFHAGVRMRLDVTRAEFEELTSDLLERTQNTTSQVLKEAGLDWPRIDRVLIVGGATRMPMIGQMLRQLSGQEPDYSQSADEVVAHGAALYAAMLLGEANGERAAAFELVNVNAHSLGVVGRDTRTRQKVNVVLIPKNTPLPCRKLKRFKTAHPNQPTVKVQVVEGENPRPEHCISLGECVVRDLPPNLPAGSLVEVEYRYAANGTISVGARVPRARRSAFAEIQRHVSRTLEDLEVWRRRMCGRIMGRMPSPAETNPLVSPPHGSDRAIDRTLLVQALDARFVRMGELAMGQPLAPALEKGRQAALAAVEQLRQAQETCRQSEAACLAAGSNQTVRLAGVAAQDRPTWGGPRRGGNPAAAAAIRRSNALHCIAGGRSTDV
ncbi:MAG TPA: Hsp70 family protein [Pirellulales bacterium]|nr:Hsp70 family protein [Pirellulales bacterium]